MAPLWLDIIARLSLLLALATAAAIAADIRIAGNRQQMTVMELVWPVTALYAGPLAWVAYARYGRQNGPKYRSGHRHDSYSKAVSNAIAVSHCGAGCTLGDVVGEWLVFGFGLELAGAALWPELIVDFSLAFVLGIAFQYLTIAPMRELGPAAGLRAALKADTLSLLCFELGLFGWMALSFFVLFPSPSHLRPDSPAYWLMMQVGMLLGFLTAYPANAWLIGRGIKEAM
jgi:Domain of unknown function (DUF4396)